MKFIDKGFYWVKFNGAWTMAQYLKSGALQKPEAEWRIDGDLYLPSRVTDVVPARILTPDEWNKIELEKATNINCILTQTEKISILMERNLWQRILNKHI